MTWSKKKLVRIGEVIAIVIMVGLMIMFLFQKPEIKPEEAEVGIIANGGKKLIITAEIAADTQGVVKGNTAFALDLYGRLKDREGNLFFSPYSISTALAMTYTGARGNTAGEMANVLHLPRENIGKTVSTKTGPHLYLRSVIHRERLAKAFANLQRTVTPGKKKAYQLHVANALWGQKGYKFLPEFLKLNKQYYGAGVREVDYGKTEKARKTINAWVEDQTRDKIKNLIPKGILDPLVRLVLTNAIYFKGDWLTQFNKKFTRDAPFHTAAGKTVNAPLMYVKAKFPYADTGKLQILELPYTGNDLSMVVLLPRVTGDDYAQALAKLEVALTPDKLDAWVKTLHEQEVAVYLPRFRTTLKFRLDKQLQALGMRDAFAMSADFSGMNGRKDLYISAVLHKAFVEVNEKGTEAAAATAVVMRLKSAAKITVFRADHPFIFLIRHKPTGSILFLGRLANPKADE